MLFEFYTIKIACLSTGQLREAIFSKEEETPWTRKLQCNRGQKQGSKHGIVYRVYRERMPTIWEIIIVYVIGTKQFVQPWGLRFGSHQKFDSGLDPWKFEFFL